MDSQAPQMSSLALLSLFHSLCVAHHVRFLIMASALRRRRLYRHEALLAPYIYVFGVTAFLIAMVLHASHNPSLVG